MYHTVLLTQYCSGVQIENSEMGGACSAYGEEERYIRGFWWENLREREHLEEPGIDGRINIKMDLQEMG